MRHLARAPFVPGGPFVARKTHWLDGKKVTAGDPVDATKIPRARQAVLYRTGLIGMATPEPETEVVEVPEIERPETSLASSGVVPAGAPAPDLGLRGDTSPPFPAPKPKKRSRSKPKG